MRVQWLAVLLLVPAVSLKAEDPIAYRDPNPQEYHITARASEIDRRAKPHPEINFVFEKDGKPQDVEHAMVDTRVAPQGKLVIWLMGYNDPLFKQTSSYGLHAIQVHYANGWFSIFGKEPPPPDEKFLGKIRLEAATGQDFSDVVKIPKADGIAERAFQFVKFLAKQNPQAKWDFFLTEDGKGLKWNHVILAGASHGSTTAARFAKHQKVDRVVMFCGPRDQYDNWQALPSATPANRYFGFSHILDGGWSGDHYCRSWELLGLNEFGPTVDIDTAPPPYGNTRRLITAVDVGNNADKAHNCVQPGGNSPKDAEGKFVFEPVWRYMFTHPVDEVGQPTPGDPDCNKDLRPATDKKK
ncbi:BPSS1187 family protein [Planctomicrobium piriforme]|uniref:Alpha/beta hydrolase family protein n=1 Tax=Planctomicrobium piriforme TaxID=1576369 RepID=A0A1I3QU99_9PLAN|nr:hypothetical protein [Planctomicrobium piriforme]SFJ36821.1 hypothetical protein SAMN05421753_11926 [Planctomicrobium piriforme]